MLRVNKTGRKVRVETATVILEWDADRGGQITRCDVKDARTAHPVLYKGACAPNLTLELPPKRLSLADFPVSLSFGRQDEQCFIFSTRGKLGDLFTVEQTFEVFREGVVFCEFNIQLQAGKQVNVRNAEMRFDLNVNSAGNRRLCYVGRRPHVKQDVTCIHVLSEHGVSLDAHKRIDTGQLLALVGLDLGWDRTRYYSNRLEMVIEDSTSIGGGMTGPTRTVAGPQGDKWSLVWKLCQDCSEVLKPPFLYRNRWALLCGAARTESGPNATPGRRNNVMAARICHVMYPYVREGNEWPWTSVPVRQTFYQDAQLAKGNPPLQRVDEAAELGANVMILHQFWMTNGGSNGEPAAEYKAFDPDWLKAFVDRAHEKNMRVGFYTRGIEHYCLYSDFFERFLRKDWDGLYVDWATPFALGFTKTSSMHCSAYNWFMFSRALRQRVGEGGFLIGHTTHQTYMSFSVFDAVITGEFSVMHSGLLANPELSASYAGLDLCGVNLISGNSPDREVFSGQRAAGFCAGLGYSTHPFMEPDKPFRDCNAYIQPLWDLWCRLGTAPARMFNPAVGTGEMLCFSDEALHPLVLQAQDLTSLVLVANLGDTPVSGSVEVDFSALGLPKTARMLPLNCERTHPAQVHGRRILVEDMQPCHFAGVLVR